MATIVTTARIRCRSEEARVKVLSFFRAIASHSLANEPGVLTYLICIPSDTDPATKSESDIYMVEHYADAQAQQAHMEAPPVQDLIALFSNPNQDENPLAGPPEVWNGGVIADMPPKTRILVAEETSGDVVGVTLAHLDAGSVDMGKWEELIRWREGRESKGLLGLSVLGTEQQGEVRALEVCRDGIEARPLERTDVPGAVVKWQAELRAVGGYFGQGKIGVKI